MLIAWQSPWETMHDLSTATEWAAMEKLRAAATRLARRCAKRVASLWPGPVSACAALS